MAQTSQATITTYTVSADYFAALGSPPTFLEDYEADPPNTTFGDGLYHGLTYVFPAEVLGRIDDNFNRIDFQSLAAERGGGPSNPGFFFAEESIFVTFPEPVLAAGVFINADEGSDEYFLGVASLSAAVATSGTFDPDFGLYFVGLISDTPFTTIEIGAGVDAPSGWNIDNLTYQGVPEPATCGLLVLGALCLAAGRRWRRA
ncbi:MAG: PEP-CTERM sorting domain-containing protein [Planctomycetia bacterium]|nr:PEP-CTERM sorting domain-containing protein [Planctomycetia bacterium]